MKRLAPVFTLVIFSFVFLIGAAHAQLGSNSSEKLVELSQAPVQSNSVRTDVRTTQTTIDRSANLQTRALNEIQRRITSLTNALEKINAFENASQDTKTVLTAQIQDEIDNLTELQTQIQSETDQAVIKELAQTIVSSYRTYAVFLPKIRTVLAGEGILTLSEKILGVHERLATQVSDLELEGVDTSDMEQTLIDIEESVLQAQTDANDAISLVTPLSPEDFPSNRTVFQNARTLLRSARLSLVSSRDSLRELVNSIKTSMASEKSMTDAMTDEVTSGSQAAPSNTFNVETSN